MVKKIEMNTELKSKLLKAENADQVAEILKEAGQEASADDVGLIWQEISSNRTDANLSLNELENVSGGFPNAEEYVTEEDVEYCDGDYFNGRHEWVKTGNHKEDPFLVFWTRGLDEYRCTKCGATKWLSD